MSQLIYLHYTILITYSLFVLHNRERLNIAHALMLKFLFLIILISHVRKIEREE